MSYLVLARKYRPRGFDAMVGQEHVVQALANALTQQRLHHAYLFTGTRGVGKTTVSRILAKSLNCTGADGGGGITATPCGVCPACRDIDTGRFVDYVELDAASNRGVEEITQLLDQAVYKPVVGRFKVYMIDEVHMLSNHAFNAMLKTLEEPPEYLKFVLATTDPQKVPPTVLSRCLQFNLRPMAVTTVEEHLARVLAEEAIPAEAGALRLLARGARGSMRDGLSLCDQAIAFGGGRVEEATVRRMLGAVDRGHVVRLLEALAGRDGPGLLAAVDALRAAGLAAAGTLEEMAELLQRMAVLQAVPSSADASDPEQADAQRLAAAFAADETALLYSMCLHGRAELGLAPDEYGGLTMVLLRMLAFRPESAPGTAPGAVSGALSGARPAAAPRAAEPVASTSGASAPGASAAGVAARLPEAPAARPAVPLQSPQAAKAQVAVPGAGAEVPARPAGSDPAGSTGSTRPSPRPSPVEATPAAGSVPVAAVVPAPSQPQRPEAGRPEAARPDPARPAAPARAARPAEAPAARRPPPTDDLPPWLDAPDGEPPVAEQDAADAFDLDDLPTPTRAGASADTAEAGPRGAHPAPAAATATDRLQPTPLGERWVALALALAERGVIGALVKELAWQAQCIRIDDAAEPPTWTLRVDREILRAPTHVDKLQAALVAHLGQPLRLATEPGATVDTPALRQQAERERRQLAAEAAIAQDPDVALLLSQFKSARIVPGSIQPC